MDQLPRLEKRKLICLLLFTCNYVQFCGFCLERFLFPLSAWDGLCVLLWHSLSLPYNYFVKIHDFYQTF